MGKNNPPVLLLFDEFTRIGKVESITNALSTLRSKNVHITLVVQSVAQLDKLYGEKNRRIIFDNCQFQIVLRASDPDTQRYIAELIGTCIRQQNSSSEHTDAHLRTTGYSDQQSEVREWAVHPHTLSTLEEIIFLTPYGAYQLDKYQPYLDSNGMVPIPTSRGLFDYWMALFNKDTKGNPDAVQINIETRIKNAAKRVDSTRRKQRKAEMKTTKEQQE